MENPSNRKWQGDFLSKERVANSSLTPSRGIPEFSLVEKITSVVPVKLQPSVKRAIPKPQSTWIREVIIKTLERETEEIS